MWVSHGTYVNESWHKCEWVILLWVILFICAPWHVSESWHIYKWVMAHTWMSHLIMSPLVHMCAMTCEWVMAQMWMSHGTNVNESSYYESSCAYVRHDVSWIMAQTLTRLGNALVNMWVSHGTYVNESWHICERVILLWVILFICAPWLIMNHGADIHGTRQRTC